MLNSGLPEEIQIIANQHAQQTLAELNNLQHTRMNVLINTLEERQAFLLAAIREGNNGLSTEQYTSSFADNSLLARLDVITQRIQSVKCYMNQAQWKKGVDDEKNGNL